MLAIAYKDLEKICEDREIWRKYPHSVLLQATPEQRFKAVTTLLDRLRKALVIDAELLQRKNIEQLKREVNQALK